MLIASVQEEKRLCLAGRGPIGFDPTTDILFSGRTLLPRHPNALPSTAIGPDAAFAETYYSIGGGFVVAHGEDRPARELPSPASVYGCCGAGAQGVTIADLQRANERVARTDDEILAGIARL